MGEVQWIKLYIDMFDRRKINKIRRLPAGNDILLFWVMLLATAGKCNAGGMIYITERVPFTKEDLADEFDFEISTIELALKAFVEFDMIDLYDDGFISVCNWERYQNTDKLAEMREQTRKRVAKCREKKRLSKCNATSNDTVTQCNAIELDKEKDKEKESNTTTTTETRVVEGEPSVLEVTKYLEDTDPRFHTKSEAYTEATKFHAYNAMRGWDCLPDWQKAADLWVARIDDKKG